MPDTWLDDYIARTGQKKAESGTDPVSSFMAIGSEPRELSQDERAAARDERMASGPFAGQSLEPSMYEKMAPWLLPAAKVAAAAPLAGLGAIAAPALLPAGLAASPWLAGAAAIAGGAAGGLYGQKATDDIAQEAANRDAGRGYRNLADELMNGAPPRIEPGAVDVQQEMASEREALVSEHPVAARGEEMALQLLSGAYPGRGADVLNRVIGSGIGATLGAAPSIVRGEMPSGRDVAEDALAGLLFNKQILGGGAKKTPIAIDDLIGGPPSRMPLKDTSRPYDPYADVPKRAENYIDETTVPIPKPNSSKPYQPFEETGAAAAEYLEKRKTADAAMEDLRPLGGGELSEPAAPGVPSESPSRAYVRAQAERMMQEAAAEPHGPPDPLASLLNPLAARGVEAADETAGLYAKERASRGRIIDELLQKEGGAGLDKAREAMSGELPKAEFNPQRPTFSDSDIAQLKDRIANSDLKPFEKLGASKALNRLLDPQNKVGPRKHEIKYFERVFGEEITRAVSGKAEPARTSGEPTLSEALEPGVLFPKLGKGEFLGSLGGGLERLEWSKTERAKAIRKDIVDRLGRGVSAAAATADLVSRGVPHERAVSVASSLFPSKPTTAPSPVEVRLAAKAEAAKEKASLSDQVLKLSSLARSIPTTIVDMSNLNRQLVYAKGTKEYWQAIPKSVHSFFSTEVTKANDAHVRKYAPMWEKFGMDLMPLPAERRGSFFEELRRPENLAKREEAAPTSLVEHIPIAGVAARAANRSAATLINSFRINFANSQLKAITMDGSVPSEKAMRGIVEAAHVLSGRGNLPNIGGVDFNQASPILNSIVFSSRLLKSRADIMVNPLFYARLPGPVRKKVIGSVMASVGMNIAMIAAWNEARKQFGEERAKAIGWDKVETDLRSAEAGKGKIGNTRFDIWGGEQQLARFMVQFAKKQRKSSSGNIYNLTGASPVNPSRGDLTWQFTRSKLAPLAGMFATWLTEKNFQGKKPGARDYIESVLPMIGTDTFEAAEQNPNMLELVPAAAAASFVGTGVSSYQSGGLPAKLELMARRGDQSWKMEALQAINNGTMTQKDFNDIERSLKTEEQFSRMNSLSVGDLESTLDNMNPSEANRYAPMLQLKRAERRISEIEVKQDRKTDLERKELRSLRAYEKKTKKQLFETFKAR